jgi:ferric-dicitrate binding protein FerR (iron transport regulator)
MADLLDTLLFRDDLSDEEREKVRARLDDDPALADAWAHWRRARAHVREQLDTHLSDRRLLVLYVLEQDGHADALTTSEQAALDAARDDIARALDRVPALERVVERIRDERADFEEAWATYAEEPEAAPAGTATSRGETPRADRSPRAPGSRDASPARRWTRRLALAVLVVGLAAGAFLLWPQGASPTTVTVADGAVRTVDLGGGATARVVGAATLTHPAERPEQAPRRVTLQAGRAFFDVPRQDEGSSFVVETPTATAAVLGTQFGVTTTADTTEVVLATGSVRVGAAGASDASSVVLQPGEKSWVARGGAPAAPSPTDLTAALDWTGLFVFRSVPLSTIADRLERRYGVPITVADALADEPITGTFEREQPVQEVLGTLAATLGATVERDGDAYRLVPGR